MKIIERIIWYLLVTGCPTAAMMGWAIKAEEARGIGEQRVATGYLWQERAQHEQKAALYWYDQNTSNAESFHRIYEHHTEVRHTHRSR